ncbi:unnamed protein product [Cuscuta campestris]|uniref:Uncharacterized protein n=1 Tax=Cuscuta campestris TaxID=132261 RepID=A0A484KYF4_9ASTE|nr:unnamed protein product [Cuscuta campestris]
MDQRLNDVCVASKNSTEKNDILTIPQGIRRVAVLVSSVEKGRWSFKRTIDIANKIETSERVSEPDSATQGSWSWLI